MIEVRALQGLIEIVDEIVKPKGLEVINIHMSGDDITFYSEEESCGTLILAETFVDDGEMEVHYPNAINTTTVNISHLF